MKKFFTLVLLLTCFRSMAQENSLNKGAGFGFQLNQYQKDFGFGLNANTPFFANEKVAIRVRANLMYLEHFAGENITWSPYGNVSIGMVGVGGYVTENIKLYGEGGLIGLLPSNKFSSENLVLGGYGLFGFEFYMQKSFNYFIEIGGVGTGAVADNVPSKPIYSNGLSISTGFRVMLP